MRQIKYKKTISENYDKLAAPNTSSKMRRSVGLEKSIGEYFYISVDDLLPYRKQARKRFDEGELNNLAETIKEHGVLQPLSVIKTSESGKFQVVSGERRLRASKLAGLDKVPCIILENEDNAEEIAIIENIQRADLHPVELADAYQSLLENYNHGDQIKLANKLGVSKSNISEIITLSKFPHHIKKYLVDHNLRSRDVLRKLNKYKTEEDMRCFLENGKNILQPKFKKKVLYNFYIENEKVLNYSNSHKLTELQKNDLKEMIQNILNNL